MSFQATPARSSRITKSYRRPSSVASSLGLRKSTSSPSKSNPRKQSIPSNPPGEYDEPLNDTGIPAALASDLNFRDVPQYMQHIRSSMFSPIPERGAGMNSTRIAEVLNYRKSLPPIVTVAHIDALSTSTTRTEREINELAQADVLRRIVIPQRGIGSSAVGDGVALVSEWHGCVRGSPHLSPELKEKYIGLMSANPTSATVPGSSFTPSELSTLTAAGFLTTPTIATSSSVSLFAMPGKSSLVEAGSRHASGSLGAVGGIQAPYLPSSASSSAGGSTTTTYNFSLPSTGAHIHLLISARQHLLTLLKKGSRHKEAPMDVLRERWDGGISSTGEERTEKKRARGEFTGVMPGRTKKWKAFWGLRFEWVVEECVGAGLVECFETRSVGVGVRVVG